MAINSRERRVSMLNFSSMDDMLPHPDGTIEKRDRATFLNLYSGIPLDDPSAVTVDVWQMHVFEQSELVGK